MSPLWSRRFGWRLISLLLLALFQLCACGYIPLDPRYPGPQIRPPEIDQYYSKGTSYSTSRQEVLRQEKDYTIHRIFIESQAGTITADYYRLNTASDNLIFVFPLLGGKNVIADYFAEYFARHGFDTAIIHRNNDFKDPQKVDQIEELLRDNVVRDRIAVDFFEREFHKKNFGTFGISRGAMNVAISAGADDRLKYNVMALGGTDIVSIFKKSNQSRLRFYRESVMAQKKITREQFFDLVSRTIKTEPGRVAKYIDAKNTLLFLSMFDRTVPFRFGLRLREQLGNPRTVILAADHYTAILYTQFVPLLPPIRQVGIFPLDYIETESLAFYRKSFGTGKNTLKMVPIAIAQMPFNLLVRAINALFW